MASEIHGYLELVDRGLHLEPGKRDDILNELKTHIEDRADELAMIEVRGPVAGDAVRSVFGVVVEGERAGVLTGPGDSVWVLTQGRPSASTGYRLVGQPSALAESWSALTAEGVVPMGEETAEILRIEAGICGYGAELTEAHNPWEAGLDAAIHMDKGCYIGQEVIARLDTYDKVKQHIVGILLGDDAPPSAGDGVFAGDRQVGQVTSAARSPGLERAIALAYVRSAWCAPGTTVAVSGSSETDGQSGQIAALPFVLGV